MNNIWRNARHLSNLVTQIETGTKTQRPSDDPLLAARSLRYRTILAEAEQFQRNVQQGMAWMEVSEAAFNNVLTGTPTNPSLMQRIYTRLVEAAQTGTNTLEDQRAIMSELRQYFEQMFEVDMNQTYLGRYVFSGFHTDQPPVLKNDWPGRSFIITQDFVPRDVERVIAFHRETPTSPLDKVYANIVKLPFTNANFDFDPTLAPAVTGNPPMPGITLADGTQVHVITTVSNAMTELGDAVTAYRPADTFTDGLGNELPVIHFLSDTGELVMSDAVRDLMNAAGGLNVVYEKNNLRAGELNPMVYFQSAEIITTTENGVTTREAQHFHAASQNIQMEISPSAHITVNSHASNILTANLFADLKRLFNFADSLVASDPRVIEEYFRVEHNLVDDDLDKNVYEFLSDEQAALSGAMHDRINNMLELIMRHAGQAQREHTALGSRMQRLEMTGIRLEEDEIAYTALLSENEDTDLAGTIMQKNAAEAAFGHALMAIARTTQLSLADFINR